MVYSNKKTMALFQPFYTLSKPLSQQEDEQRVRTIYINLDNVQSWEYITPKYTKLHMLNGQSHIVLCPIEEVTDVMNHNVDAYGRLFDFNLN